jgi:hypothetical protein
MLMLDDKMTINYRTYENILSIMANIGGLKEFIFILISLGMKPLTRFSLNMHFLYEYFSQKSRQPKRGGECKILNQ